MLLQGYPVNILCFSPLRWDFMLQRPQHLLLRFARHQNVYFFEDPIFDANHEPFLSCQTRSETLWKVVPHLNAGLTAAQSITCLKTLLNKFLENTNLDQWIFWYYSSSYLSFTEDHQPKLIVYDCLEELSALRATEVNRHEKNLLARANVIIRGGVLRKGRNYNWDKASKEVADEIRLQRERW